MILLAASSTAIAFLFYLKHHNLAPPLYLSFHRRLSS
jgi:hypothetical protein